MNGVFIGLDLETTGVDPKIDKIIEIGMVKIVDGEIADTYHTLVNPGIRLPLKIKRLTGITDEMLADAPKIDTVLTEVISFINNYPVIGHNVDFDCAFLLSVINKDLNFIQQSYDTVELARIVLPDAPNHRLHTLCELCNINTDIAHRALEDARGAALLAVELVRRLSVLNIKTLEKLASLLQISQSPWGSIVQKICFEKFTHGGSADNPSKLINFNGNINRTNINNSNNKQPVDVGEVIKYLDENGLISNVLERYEFRPQQLDMAKAVTNAMNSGEFLLAEAGTGTGKSMAYLLPAVLWSLKNKQRVVISTHTINLQEQLWNKDVPLLQSMEGMIFTATLVKGKNNYICLRRWDMAMDTKNNITPREAGFYARLLVWLSITHTGDRSEINISWQDADIWSNICADSDGCVGTRCKHHQRLCFNGLARRKAEQSNIIIANHSLVFSDIQSGNKVLPQYSVLIIDEAHHLENAATDHLGVTFTRSGLSRWLGEINRITSRLHTTAPMGDPIQWKEYITNIKNAQHRVRESADVFYNIIGEFIKNNDKSKSDRDQTEKTRRNTLRIKPGCDLTHMSIEIENLTQRIAVLSNHLQQLAANMDDITEQESDLAGEVINIAEAGLALAVDIAYVCDSNNIVNVHWIDGEIKDGDLLQISITAAPVEVGKMLHQRLYMTKDTVVFTSATLTVKGSFKHFIERSGLDLSHEDRVKCLKVDSPFNYNEQSLLYVLNDLPEQTKETENEYLQALAETIIDLSIISGGKMLVLFTAHRVLRNVYDRVKPYLEDQDILVLGHVIDGSRTRLVEEFKNTNRAVLFGAASFWEGLDIPGQDLSVVVLVKLPFWPPDTPIIEARVEALARDNKNGFYHYSLPEAVIRFKQGFGRLIRTQYDYGTVVVLDKRVVTKRYGRDFLGSLPVSTYMRGNKSLLLDKIKKWLNKVD